MASSRSEENVILKHFQHIDGVTVLVSPVILWTHCIFIFGLADVIANGSWAT